MNLNLPLSLASISSFVRYPLAMLGVALLCCAPPEAVAQSVTFAGQQVTLPVSDLKAPVGLALDSAVAEGMSSSPTVTLSPVQREELTTKGFRASEKADHGQKGMFAEPR
jgi:hypothetical protein